MSEIKTGSDYSQSGAKEGYQELLNVCSKWEDFTKTFYSSVCLISRIICDMEGVQIIEGNKLYSLKTDEESIAFVFEKIRECVESIKTKNNSVEN